MGAADNDDSADEDEEDMGKVKIGLVTLAVLDPEYWGYGDMVECVGLAP